jgi:hypothetical protein
MAVVAVVLATPVKPKLPMLFWKLAIIRTPATIIMPNATMVIISPTRIPHSPPLKLIKKV